MTFTVGRASFANNPRGVDRSGDEVTVHIDIKNLTVDAAKALQEQVLGLRVGNVVPVTWSDDDSWDGFYIVTRSPLVDPHGLYLSNGFMRTALTLGRLGRNFKQPVVETTWQNGVRDKTYATGVTATPVVQAPYDSVTLDPAFPYAWAGVAVAEGTDNLWVVAYPGTDDVAGSGTALWSPSSPSAYFDNSPYIEYKGDDGNWYKLVGRNIPVDIAASAANVRVGNGSVRFGWTTDQGNGTTNDPTLLYEAWDGSAWQIEKDFYFTGTARQDPIASVSVLRNRSDGVSIRYQLTDSVHTNRTYPLTMSLARAFTHAVFVWGDESGNQREIRDGYAGTWSRVGTEGYVGDSGEAAGGTVAIITPLEMALNGTSDGMEFVDDTETELEFALGFLAGGGRDVYFAAMAYSERFLD